MRRRHRARFGCMFIAALAMISLLVMASRSAHPAWIVAVLLAMFAFMFVGLRRYGFPFADIAEAADKVGSGDFSTRVSERGPPSLRSVARAFNAMTTRLQANEVQRRHMMSDIAHELRTPLAVIQGRLEALIDGVYARDDQHMQELLDETRLLARLVEDLRTLANAESGALALQKEPTDLVVLVHDAVNAMFDQANAHGITLHVEDVADLPLITLDPLRIREVMLNLLSNAIRHTPPGGSVNVAMKQESDRIVISVRDTGSGIAPEDLPRIFDRFYKSAASTGSGLGLTIARNLVEAHGGDIRADSRIGEGTSITFTLPSA